MESISWQGPQRSDMRAFDVRLLVMDVTTDFDLFLDVDGHMVLFAPAPYRWSLGEIERLREAGHKALQYRASDWERVAVYERIRIIPPVDMGLPPRERLTQITEIAASLTRVLYEHPISEAMVAQTRMVADSMVATISEDPTSVTALTKLARHDLYTYYHSSRVAAYAVALAIQMSATDQSHLREMAYGCFVHDIGKNRVDLSVLNKAGKLTDSEFALLRQHPLFGHEQLAAAGVSTVGLEIVQHHHERIDGKGYPHGIAKNELLDEVRIASFADVFDALTTNRPYQDSRSRYEALDFIRFKLMDGLSRDVFRAMVQLLDSDRDVRRLVSTPVGG